MIMYGIYNALILNQRKESKMTRTEKVYYLWNKKLQDAIDCGHPEPFDYADKAVQYLISKGSYSEWKKEQKETQEK